MKLERVINMALKFDIKGLNNEILNKLHKELVDACIAWENEVKSKTTHGLFGGGINPYIESHLKRESKAIVGFLEVNTYVLAESYGTGSFMLTNYPEFQEYRRNKGDGQGQWNPERKGTAIVGRKAGDYVDLFGRKHHTSGAFKGVNIEGKKVYTRKKETERDYYISPTHPSYAVQLATNWLYKTYLPRAYKLAVKQINFAKYLIES